MRNGRRAGYAHPGHEGEKTEGVGQGLAAEKDPADHDDEQGLGLLEGWPESLPPLFQSGAFHNQKETVIEAPEDEGPTRPMPEAAEEKDEEQIQECPDCSLSAAAERDVEVVAEPARQGDMPSPPEFADRAGDIRVVEVFREMKTKESAYANGHVRIAGEIKVDLQGVAERGQPGERGGEFPAGQGKDLVGDQGQGVGQQHLFAKPQDKALGSFGKPLDAAVAGMQIVGYLGIAQDGAGQDHREKGKIEGEIERILGRLDLSPGDVNQVGNGLEGDKGDADRPVNGGKGQFWELERQQQGVEVVGNKVCILEKGEHCDIEYYPEDEDSLGGPAVLTGSEELPTEEVDEDGGEERQEVDALSPGIEEQTGEEQKKVSQALGGCKDEKQHPRQEEKKEGDGGEDHWWLPWTIGDRPRLSGILFSIIFNIGCFLARPSCFSGNYPATEYYSYFFCES